MVKFFWKCTQLVKPLESRVIVFEFLKASRLTLPMAAGILHVSSEEFLLH